MPELPDVTVYTECLQAKVGACTLTQVTLQSPFLLRTAVPPIDSARGRGVQGIERLGKRVVIALEGEYFLVIHLMIAGRLHWQSLGAKAKKLPPKNVLAQFEFEDAGTLTLTEAGTQRRASLHLVQGRCAMLALGAGGIEPLRCDTPSFAAALTRENRTLKKALTDPHTVSGIGNAYSDEILHRARLSPFAITRTLSAEQLQGLHEATKTVLEEWTARLRAQAAGNHGWPVKVTAFQPEMAVHGRYGQPCPVCSAPVQRITSAGSNEANYCARCQTGGKLLADRALSKLLHESWPKHIDDL
jgi:formamidopyrimidine-DNA glycosylase